LRTSAGARIGRTTFAASKRKSPTDVRIVRGLRHVLDHVAVALVVRLHDRRSDRGRHRRRIGVEHHDLALDLALLDQLRQQERALVRRGRAAVRLGRHRHDELAPVAEEPVELAPHRALLECAEAGRCEVPGLGIAGDGLLHVLDAGRQHEEVVVDPPAVAQHQRLPGAVDVDHGRRDPPDAESVEPFVAELEVRLGLVAGDVVRAHRARHEPGVGLDERHREARVLADERTGDTHAAPAATDDGDPCLGLRGTGGRTSGDQRRRGEGREARSGGLHELTTAAAVDSDHDRLPGPDALERMPRVSTPCAHAP
jgi:hypothetical protein